MISNDKPLRRPANRLCSALERSETADPRCGQEDVGGFCGLRISLTAMELQGLRFCNSLLDENNVVVFRKGLGSVMTVSADVNGASAVFTILVYPEERQLLLRPLTKAPRSWRGWHDERHWQGGEGAIELMIRHDGSGRVVFHWSLNANKTRDLPYDPVVEEISDLEWVDLGVWRFASGLKQVRACKGLGWKPPDS